MAEMGKECGFPSNFDMPRPFTPRKTELQRKTELPRKTELQPIISPNGLVSQSRSIAMNSLWGQD